MPPLRRQVQQSFQVSLFRPPIDVTALKEVCRRVCVVEYGFIHANERASVRVYVCACVRACVCVCVCVCVVVSGFIHANERASVYVCV